MYFSRFPDATLTEADVKELLDERAADIVNSIPRGRRRHPVIYWEDEGGLQVDELASQDQLVAWMEDQTEAFTYADIEEANGCAKSSAERAVKAVRDRLEETTKGRSKAFIWNG